MGVQETGTYSIDRRAARTRARLHDALRSLIAEQGYAAIGVKDICARADVSRSTFYAHYATKNDLMRSSLARATRHAGSPRPQPPEQIEPGAGSFTFLHLLQHARDHFHMHERLGEDGVAIAHEGAREALSGLVRHALPADLRRNRRPAMPREFLVQYVVGATMAVITWWLESGARLPAVRVDAMLRSLAVNGVAGLDRT
jgi:AcrR family transcriptional regulator